MMRDFDTMRFTREKVAKTAYFEPKLVVETGILPVVTTINLPLNLRESTT